eukprot:8918920-Lingulodinium_polyedra.AAC.1
MARKFECQGVRSPRLGFVDCDAANLLPVPAEARGYPLERVVRGEGEGFPHGSRRGNSGHRMHDRHMPR